MTSNYKLIKVFVARRDAQPVKSSLISMEFVKENLTFLEYVVSLLIRNKYDTYCPETPFSIKYYNGDGKVIDNYQQKICDIEASEKLLIILSPNK